MLSNLCLCIYKLLLPLISTFQKNISLNFCPYEVVCMYTGGVKKELCVYQFCPFQAHIFVWHKSLSLQTLLLMKLFTSPGAVAYVVLVFFCSVCLICLGFFSMSCWMQLRVYTVTSFDVYICTKVNMKSVTSHLELQSQSIQSEIYGT